jgi:outer membrane protein assembly factor BamA
MCGATYQHQHFFPLDRKLTLALNGEVGIGQEPMATKMLPFFKNFYAGGIGSVRGFESGSLGPRDPATNEAVGWRQAPGRQCRTACFPCRAWGRTIPCA